MIENLFQIKISVRNLVEFILRSGDIDQRVGSGEKDAMLLGGKIHRKIQKEMGASYQAEVFLRHEIELEQFSMILEGRADGIIETKSGIVIDEIKGTMRELDKIKEPIPVHLAQAKCYAYMYGCTKQIEEISVQMTYCHMETEEIKRFLETYSMEELKNWFFALVHEYEKWARYQFEWKEKRNTSIKKVEFPFVYREGQRDLVRSVYTSLYRKKTLFIQAPTGVGKTMATVFPTVKAVGEELGDKIFYLTAKTITRTVAWQAFEQLKKEGLRMKVLILTAKEKTCFCEEVECNPKACPYAKGHYDRVNDAVYELLTTSDEMSREILEEQARKWRVCPYEMSLDVSLWVDAIICDYNYVFDPNAHLRRFFGDGVSGEYLFLIDEAHNLVDRGREMYTASLYKEDFLKIKRMVKHEDSKLVRKLEDCNKLFLALKRECERYQVYEDVSHIYIKLLSLLTRMDHFLEKHRAQEDKEKDFFDDVTRKEFMNFYFDLRMFLSIYEKLDENYVIYTELEAQGGFKLCLYCVNPAVNLKEYLEKGRSAVFFSATLLPIHYYKKLLSTKQDDYAIYAESTFDTNKRLLMLGADVSTKYTLRGKKMYQKYADYLLTVAKSKKGNYIAFFPSYQFMEEVYDQFLELIENEKEEEIDYIMQSRYMSEESREIFLESFEEVRRNSLIGFCVLGGIFSEGIDLSEDKLIGAVIIGTGLPQVCLERELLKNYFDQKKLRGFDYAYLYPGMNKVLQAAGRVIRTEEDEGVILLLDERFLDPRCQEVFPREWRDYQICKLDATKQKIKDFWKNKE